MKLRVILSTFAIALLAVSFSPVQSSASTHSAPHKVVHDRSGDIVHTLRSGTCVRSSAEASQDECGSRPIRRTELSEEQSVVYFEFDSAELTADAKMRLERAAEMLSNASDVASASIVGYADRIGSSEYNIKLSERRAEAVKNYLVSNGYVDVSVAEVRALGEAYSKGECQGMSRQAAIDCLADDRRVEIELIYVK